MLSGLCLTRLDMLGGSFFFSVGLIARAFVSKTKCIRLWALIAQPSPFIDRKISIGKNCCFRAGPLILSESRELVNVLFTHSNERHQI